MQTRAHSLLESAVNVIVGYVVALVSQLSIFPWFGIHIPLSDNLLIGLWFTGISLVRSYALRRWLNRRARHPSLKSGRDRSKQD